MKRVTYLLVLVFIVGGCSNPQPVMTTVEDQQPDSATIEAEPTHAPDSEPIATIATAASEALDLTQLWSYGLTSIRTGEPLIREGGEHMLDASLISYGYNRIVDENGNMLTPRGTPIQGGEQLILTDDYQADLNLREVARIFTIMAPIRDTILYHFEDTSQAEWLEITIVLTLNNLKTEDAAEINGRSILSTEQVYDYIASGEAEGSPVMRYLEEAELELKCLAFQDFDFTNPEGNNHCEEHGIEVGAGIKLP